MLTHTSRPSISRLTFPLPPLLLFRKVKEGRSGKIGVVSVDTEYDLGHEEEDQTQTQAQSQYVSEVVVTGDSKFGKNASKSMETSGASRGGVGGPVARVAPKAASALPLEKETGLAEKLLAIPRTGIFRGINFVVTGIADDAELNKYVGWWMLV